MVPVLPAKHLCLAADRPTLALLAGAVSLPASLALPRPRPTQSICTVKREAPCKQSTDPPVHRWAEHVPDPQLSRHTGKDGRKPRPGCQPGLGSSPAWGCPCNGTWVSYLAILNLSLCTHDMGVTLHSQVLLGLCSAWREHSARVPLPARAWREPAGPSAQLRVGRLRVERMHAESCRCLVEAKPLGMGRCLWQVRALTP